MRSIFESRTESCESRIDKDSLLHFIYDHYDSDQKKKQQTKLK